MKRGLAALLLLAFLSACSKQESPPSPPTVPRVLQLRVDPALGAENARKAIPAVSLIIDDLGEQFEAGERALALPGQVAYAFLPATPYVAAQARRAHTGGHEVLLHLPMEHPRGKLYPLGLSRATPREELRRRFDTALKSVPHARGVNNHQGSLLTELREPMSALMREIRAARNLYFVDSRTSIRSVAYDAARQAGVPATRREVFLDATREPAAIARAWQLTLSIARKRGTALAIGHPYPETLALLETELPRLASAGIRLVPPSELIRLRGSDFSRTQPRLKWSVALARLTTVPASPAATMPAAAHARASRR